MSEPSTVRGTVARGYERVADAFAGLVPAAGTGAGVAVYVDGGPVVDLWSGEAEPGRLWLEDTLCPMWSVGKGVASILAMLLVDDAQLDVDAPISSYWPEFAAPGAKPGEGAAGAEDLRGKSDARVSSILDHSLGLPYVDGYQAIVNLDEPASWLRRDRIVELLARAPLIWEPGVAHGYHSVTMGWLFAEVVRRATGRGFGDVLRAELAEPLGLELWAGLPAALHHRVARMMPPPSWAKPSVAEALGPETIIGKVMFIGNRLSFHDAVMTTMNTPEFHSSETPAIAMIGNARSLARLYGLLALDARDDSRRVASQAVIGRHVSERYRGRDALLGGDLRLGLGFQLSRDDAAFSPSGTAFGHSGLSGAHGFADPNARLGFGYVPSAMGGAITLDRRAKSLIDAVYASLNAGGGQRTGDLPH